MCTKIHREGPLSLFVFLGQVDVLLDVGLHPAEEVGTDRVLQHRRAPERCRHLAANDKTINMMRQIWVDIFRIRTF